jgi:hypothetical protein
MKHIKEDHFDKMIFGDFINMTISSQAHLKSLNEKVQRLSRDREYRAIAIGSGSTKVPCMKECDIVCSA